VRGTIHWTDAATAADAEVRLYDKLLLDEQPESSGDMAERINPNSLTVMRGCKAEKSLENAEAPASFQFLRTGYFAVDSRHSRPGALVFNRSVALKDGYRPG
jgi:glutaminyl-tRNA synthetase